MAERQRVMQGRRRSGSWREGSTDGNAEDVSYTGKGKGGKQTDSPQNKK